jgi:hypothetical protein
MQHSKRLGRNREFVDENVASVMQHSKKNVASNVASNVAPQTRIKSRFLH